MPELAIVVNDELYVHANARAVSIPYSRVQHNRHHPCDLVVIFDAPFFEMSTFELERRSAHIARDLDDLERSGGLFGIMIQVDFSIHPSRMVIRRIMRLIKYFANGPCDPTSNRQGRGDPTSNRQGRGDDPKASVDSRRVFIELCSSKWSFQVKFFSRLDRHPNIVRTVAILENNIIQSGWAGPTLIEPVAGSALPARTCTGSPVSYFILWGSLGPRIGSYQDEMTDLVQRIFGPGPTIVEFRNINGTVDLPLPLVEMNHTTAPIQVREEDPDGTEGTDATETTASRTSRSEGPAGWYLQYTPMWQARDRSELRSIVERDVELFVDGWAKSMTDPDGPKGSLRKNEAGTGNQGDG